MSARGIERASLAGMALGAALMLQPWWTSGLSVGFYLVLASVVVQNISSRCGEAR